jgi:hypothetical protein
MHADIDDTAAGLEMLAPLWRRSPPARSPDDPWTASALTVTDVPQTDEV